MEPLPTRSLIRQWPCRRKHHKWERPCSPVSEKKVGPKLLVAKLKCPGCVWGDDCGQRASPFRPLRLGDVPAAEAQREKPRQKRIFKVRPIYNLTVFSL